VVDEYLNFGAQLSSHITETTSLIYSKISSGSNVLFEGAQGTLLDIDHGTYPFVTSSNVVAGNACCGSGVGPSSIEKVWGVVKAYTTRVGQGGFPTELDNELGEELRSKGYEYGATTGRPRRCGWLDMVVVNHSVRLNGLTGIALTKMDVLTGISPIRIATSYELDGKITDRIPSNIEDLGRVIPHYREVKGWSEPLDECRSFDDLPKNARDFVETVEHLSGTPVTLVSIGPGREQSILRKPPF